MTTLHPLPKLALCLIWIAASVLIFDLGFQLAALVLACGLLWVSGQGLWRVLRLMLPFALFGLGFLTTSLLFDREAGFAVQMAQEQAGGMVARPGVVLFFRVLACGMISSLFVLTTDPGGLVRALMAQARLPAPVGYALLQALHLAPDLGRELMQLRMARAIRLGRPLRRIPGPGEVAALTVPLLAQAIRRAGRAALAMEARGLMPGRRPALVAQRLRRADVIGMLAGMGALIALVVLA